MDYIILSKKKNVAVYFKNKTKQKKEKMKLYGLSKTQPPIL